MPSEKKKNDLTRSLFEELRQTLAVSIGDPSLSRTLLAVNTPDRAPCLPRAFREMQERALKTSVWTLSHSAVAQMLSDRRKTHTSRGKLKAKTVRTEETR